MLSKYHQEGTGTARTFCLAMVIGISPSVGGDLVSHWTTAWIINLDMVVLFLMLILYLAVGVLELVDRLKERIPRVVGVPADRDGGDR